MRRFIIVLGLMAVGMILERAFNLTEVFVMFSTYLVILFGLREKFF